MSDTPTATAERSRGEATARASALVAARRPAAERLGHVLAEVVGDPDAFRKALDDGLRALADPEYLAGQQFVAPGIGPTLGVRSPLLSAVKRAFRRSSRRTPTSDLLLAADRLLGSDALELHWFAFGLLEQVIADDAERGWQLLRRAAREAHDWITVDTLAHAYGRGILDEPYRWAELEQLVYSPSSWERRLVGSTIATIPFIDRRRGREPEVAHRGLAIIEDLIGDSDQDVQRSLAWALRSLVLADADAVTAFCAREADVAAADADGNRAWVVRDALPRIDASVGARLRSRLAGVRRRPHAVSTSRAAETAGRFTGLGLGRPMPEPPLA